VLIQRSKFFGTGIESALWVGAVGSIILSLPHSGKVEAILVVALGAAICGARMRNAIFGGIAAILVVVYAAAKWDRVEPPIIVAIEIGGIGGIALAHEWKRLSTEQLFTVLAVVLPAIGYIASLFEKFEKMRAPIAILYAVAGVLTLIGGIRLRDRALLIAAT